jgi:cytochrome c biogenesis factor
MDTYFSRVIKYIPSDVVGLWVAVTGVIQSDANAQTNLLLWIAFVLGILLTAAWTLKQTKEPKKPPAITQAAISTGAFIVWVAALGGPFSTLPFYRPLYGSLLLIFYTAFVALINPPEG